MMYEIAVLMTGARSCFGAVGAWICLWRLWRGGAER